MDGDKTDSGRGKTKAGVEGGQGLVGCGNPANAEAKEASRVTG